MTDAEEREKFVETANVTKLQPKRSVITFHNIAYSINVKAGRKCCGRKQKRYILDDISGIYGPGLNAILGPTGSGKSSLLDILAGRKDPSGLSGRVLIDGHPQPENFKCMAGYVVQDDVVMGMLTVRENIEFSAALRLPQSTSAKKRAERVADVIEELGLTGCADTKVGTQFLRGVSGGERKRTSIAMELVSLPNILFLDEPTTGLDANTAFSVILALKKLSLAGRTVIFSIHQPRYAIFKLFDNLTILSKGSFIYNGPAKKALDYFQNLDYICEPHDNPADFFLDILTGGISVISSPRINDLAISNGGELTKKLSHELDTLMEEMEECNADAVVVRQRFLVDQYTKSKEFADLKHSLRPYWQKFKSANTEVKVQKVFYPTNFFRQLAIVSQRTYRNLFRNPHALLTQVFSAILLGLLIGTIYFQLDNSPTSGIQNRVGAFFFIVINHVFGNMAAVDIFIKERSIFMHESISGFYRISTYFFAKIFCDVIPARGIPLIFFGAISYWMIGFQADFSKFIFYLFNVFMTTISGTSIALVFSATVNNHTVGTLLTALIWTFMMIFSGLLLNVSSLGSWMQWLQYCSIFRYSMNALIINELKNVSMCGDSNLNGNGTVICESGNEYMRNQGIPFETAWDLWANEVALAVIAFLFLTLAYIQLRRMKKNR